MPSFLNKVFGYKKHDNKEPPEPSDTHLLDGKYEAIPSPSSPEAKDHDRDLGFSLFRRGIPQKPVQKHPDTAPHLTLQLPSKECSRTSTLVFEADPDAQIILDDATIAAKRLDPLEACILIRACSRAITECGLETLGIMHPNWFSASPDVQRKLISLFIRSLTESQTSTLSPTSTSSSGFENELHFTRSPHDVAAVLRWCLRHLSLENSRFGKDSTEWGWYNTFFHAERTASYPHKGFSELLLPQLPASHIELLIATLGLISSFASHAEANGISGSKLSKYLGLWLLVTTRAEQSDDWDRFYARWERAGRILEHLFLARLREESFEQRLPTRLQELVKHYPYSKGPSASNDDLLSRPRFSTRQYDALFIRVETVLKENAERPKQHPIQLLLEAFQLPIDDHTGDEHLAFWNALKTTVFEEATSSDPKGPQFTRIFVDETIHLLSLIPPDNNVSAAPSLFTSPITPRKRSSSFTMTLERAVRRSNADESTPISPTSPSSIVVTDWAQFAQSGFGDTQATQPLAALITQDDDVEVTRPHFLRKLSQRGKSRSRRQRSGERAPSPLDPSLSIVETKLASVHVVQIDEAFIDFWSDAIVDPISSNWPTFVVCGLKQIQSAEQPIRWLVIEQAYSHQTQSRVPSPEGRRGRSPRPSFKSDISGFRINSVFSSARKRFSVFSKSATDLDPKKSGAKTPVAGELGEMLVEEDSAPTLVGHHVDGSAAVRATVSSGVIPDITDQLNVDGISSAPAPAKEESGPIQSVANEPSIEPTPHSGGSCNGSSVSVGPTVRAPDVSVEQDSPPPTNVIVDNSVGPVTVMAPPPADTSELQCACDPVVLASGPASSAENPVSEEVEIQAAQLRQGADEAESQSVEHVAQPTDRDDRLHAKPTAEPSDVVDVADNGSRENAHTEAVAIPSTLETVALVAGAPFAQSAVIAADDDQAPEPTMEEQHVTQQPSRKASADLAAFTVDSVGQRQIDDLSPAFATQVIATETGTPPEPYSTTSVAGEGKEAKEVAELAEIPTPAPEHVALVEDTPGREVSVDACGCAEAVQIPAAKPEAFDGVDPALDDAVLPSVTAAAQTTLEAEASATPPAAAPSLDGVPVFDQDVVVETEHTADPAPEPAAEEAQPHVQDSLVLAPDASVEAVVSALQRVTDATTVEVETQATPDGNHIVEIRDAGASTLPSIGETPDPEVIAEAHVADQATPPEFKKAGDETDNHVDAVVEPETPSLPPAEEVQPSGSELPTQVHEIQPTEALSSRSNPEATNAALATVAEVIAVTAETQSLVPENAPAEDALEIAIEATEPAVGTLAITTAADPVEDDGVMPVAEETRVLSKEVALSASEPVAIAPVVQDVQAPIGIEQSSTEIASQSVDDPANPCILDDSVPEEIATGDVEAPLASHPTVVVVDAGETFVPGPDVSAPVSAVDDAQELVGEESTLVAVDDVVASQLEAAPTVGANGLQKAVEPVTSEIDVPTPSEENIPQEA